MADYGAVVADKAIETAEKRILKVYQQAAKDLKRSLSEFNKKHAVKQKEKLKMLKAGEITQAEYDSWMRGQVFIGKQWKDKLDQTLKIIDHANQEAVQLVNTGRLNVFAENYNFSAYQLEKQAKGVVSFNLYNTESVGRLIQKKPKMLPEWKIHEAKDYKWNRQKVENTITQAIIQGKDVDQITNDLIDNLCSANDNRMRTFARTAMTGAQNAGRQKQMEDAEDLGIKVKKRWVATLDNRTRELHQDLDGQEVAVDESFTVDLNGEHYEIDYPGDPSADPEMVYNCRCTMIQVYEGIDRKSVRRDEDDEEVVDMTYKEWKAAKEAGKKHELSAAKNEVSELKSYVKEKEADKTFSGIWKNDVTYKDYQDKLDSGSIAAKEKYYADAIKQAKDNGWTDKADQLQQHLDDLETFKQHGAENSQILKDLEDAEKQLKKIQDEITPAPAVQTPFGADAYSQDRKDHALWAKSAKEADDALRDRTGEVWRSATPEEKDGIYEYTQSYHKFNEPLRGDEYGTNRHLGVGNTDLNAGHASNGARLDAMTDIIDKCSYDQDIWVQRGVRFDGMDGFFGVSEDMLRHGTQAQLEQALLGEVRTEYGFMSCGTSKGSGFSGNPIIMNIYAPSGTKMMYVEPFSAFSGGSSGKQWDGLKKQKSFGGEVETILQQGTQFRITRVERRGSRLYIDMEVVNQMEPQRWRKK